MMKIVIPDIPEEGLNLNIEEKFSVDGISLVSPVKAALNLQKVEQEIIVTGSLSTEVEYTCSRCLKDYRRVMELPVTVVYHQASDIEADRHELHDDEMDIAFYQGEEIDLQELLKEQIMLNEEMKPLCDEDCRGICPRCGIYLNTDSCDCSLKETDPRLEVLKKLLEKGKE